MTRAMVGILLSVGVAWSSSSTAQQEVVIVRQFAVPPGVNLTYNILCPAGYVPNAFSISYVEERNPHLFPGRFPNDRLTGIDANNVPVDFSVPNWRVPPGGGYSVEFEGVQPTLAIGVMKLSCRQLEETSFVFNQTTVPANGVGSIAGFCPPPLVPVGQVSNADGQALATRFVVFLHGTPPTVTLMDDLSDGTHGPPTGIGRSVTNTTAGPLTLSTSTLCAPLTNAQTVIYSAPTLPGAPFTIFAPVPDGFDEVSSTFVGGLYGAINNVDLWSKAGELSSQLSFVDGAVRTFELAGTFVDGVDSRPKSSMTPKASARAVIGVLMTPSAAAPAAPTIVTVVEFYHQALDHYFITAIPKEISDLDAGVHPGWQRTGQTFKAYGIGSTGRTGRHPVCRAYGNPAVGLDSHFYSASPAECLATLANFNGAWLLEASEVFQTDLPDATTGACPAGGVPIYRVWNNRTDSNHRYTTTLALRDQMVAKGYIKEGYGPNAVTLCALS